MALQDKFDRAAELRQTILDYMNTVDEISSIAVALALGLNPDSVGHTLIKMMANGEVHRCKKTRNQVIYKAIKKVTTPASEIRDKAYNRMNQSRNLTIAEKQAKKRKTVVNAWTKTGYFNDPDRREGAYGQQGGQGALPRAFGVQSSFTKY